MLNIGVFHHHGMREDKICMIISIVLFSFLIFETIFIKGEWTRSFKKSPCTIQIQILSARKTSHFLYVWYFYAYKYGLINMV